MHKTDTGEQSLALGLGNNIAVIDNETVFENFCTAKSTTPSAPSHESSNQQQHQDHNTATATPASAPFSVARGSSLSS
jgi:hypothetical protein